MSLFFSCRLHGVPFIVAFIVPVSVIIFGNMAAFGLVIKSLHTSGKATAIGKDSEFKEARKSFAITIVVGLSWIFGVFAIRDAKLAFEYLFCIFNTLEGFLTLTFSVCDLRAAKREGQLELKNTELKKLSNSTLTPSAKPELKSKDSATDKPVSETPVTSNDYLQSEFENVASEHNFKPRDAYDIFCDPNVTRFSMKKQGSKYVTTIEMNVNNK